MFTTFAGVVFTLDTSAAAIVLQTCQIGRIDIQEALLEQLYLRHEFPVLLDLTVTGKFDVGNREMITSSLRRDGG